MKTVDYSDVSEDENSAKTLKKVSMARVKSKDDKVLVKQKKVLKMPISKLQKKLWEACRRYANILYVRNGAYYCYTCDRLIEGSNKQLGHFIPNSTSGAFLRYDMRILRWQCYNCNINNGGMGAEYYRRMVSEKGQEHVDNIFKDKNKIVNAYDRYIELLEKYIEEIKNHS